MTKKLEIINDQTARVAKFWKLSNLNWPIFKIGQITNAKNAKAAK